MPPGGAAGGERPSPPPHRGNRRGRGEPAPKRQLGLVGTAALGGTGLRSSPPHHRARPRGAPDRAVLGGDSSGYALPVLRRRHRRTHGHRSPAPLPAAGG